MQILLRHHDFDMQHSYRHVVRPYWVIVPSVERQRDKVTPWGKINQREFGLVSIVAKAILWELVSGHEEIPITRDIEAAGREVYVQEFQRRAVWWGLPPRVVPRERDLDPRLRRIVENGCRLVLFNTGALFFAVLMQVHNLTTGWKLSIEFVAKDEITGVT
jgi:hypothetical protein